MYQTVSNFDEESLRLKQELLRDFGYPPNSTEKERRVKTHTDISGGAQIKGEKEHRRGVYNCMHKEMMFYKTLDRYMKMGASAYINELAPTQVRTFFLDLDLVVKPSNRKAQKFLNPDTYVEMVKDVVFPTIDTMFPAGWRANHPHLKFAVACPNQLRDKKGGKKFGAHIRAMQIKDNVHHVSHSIYLHVDNMLRLRLELIDRLNDAYPLDQYQIDWEDTVDLSPMRNGGMRMIGMRKYKVKCDCSEPAECSKCNFGTQMFFDPTVYQMIQVIKANGEKDPSHLERLKSDRTLLWMETSISTPFQTQKEANYCHRYEIDGVECSGDVIEHIQLSQDDIDGIGWMKTTTEDGRPKIVQSTVKRKRLKKTSMEKQETRLKNAEEIADKKTCQAIEVFVKKEFTQYKDRIRVDKVIRMDAKNPNSLVRVYLRGPNCGICQNKAGKGAHQDNTYIDINVVTGAQQRCFSTNTGKECRTSVCCQKFKSKAQALPADLHVCLFPKQQRKTTNAKHPFHQVLLKGLNSSGTFTSHAELSRLFKRRKKPKY